MRSPEREEQLIKVLERIATALEDLNERIQLFGDYKGRYYKDND